MIPFSALNRDAALNDRIKAACSRVIDSGWFIMGPELERFEKSFADYCKRRYAIGVGNATDAITITLNALGVGRGDEVITAVNTAIPTIAAIVNSGATPRLVDVNDFYLMNPENIEAAITPRTRAIIPVHLYGQSCDMHTIETIAQENNLKVLEDCAQAHGAEFLGKRVPILGTGCFSFYPSKNLGCYGDGGAIVTDDEDLAKKVKLLRNYGQSDRYHAKIHGQNSRLDEMQAAILSERLALLESFNKLRRDNAEVYNCLLENLVVTPKENPENKHVYHLYVVRSDKRDALAEHLKQKQIGTAIHYPIPIHLQEAYSDLGYKPGDFPNAEKFAGEILSLPMFPGLKLNEIHHVAEAIREF